MQNERVLFHYNGHGVPRPTVNGEIWVFNSRWVDGMDPQQKVGWQDGARADEGGILSRWMQHTQLYSWKYRQYRQQINHSSSDEPHHSAYQPIGHVVYLAR